MPESIHQKLAKKIEDFKSLELAKRHLEKLESRIQKTKQKLNALQATIEKEYKDIAQLEKLSVRALFEKMLGDKEAQLEIERQEYLRAVLNFNECKKSLELLDFERKILQKKLTNYNKTKSELHNLIRQRAQSLVQEDELAKQLITDIDKEIDANIAFKRELYEAITVALKIKRALREVINNLNKVLKWGEYTLNNPDQHIRKMTYMNKAKDHAYLAKQLLQEFEDELADIYDKQNINIQTTLETFRYFIQSFFNDLILDWVVLMKIQNASHTVIQVNNKVNEIARTLQNELKTTESNLEVLIDKKEKIILELN